MNSSIIKSFALVMQNENSDFFQTILMRLNKISSSLRKGTMYKTNMNDDIDQDYLSIRSQRKRLRLDYNTFLYITAEDNGIRIVMEDSSIWLDLTLKVMLTKLPESTFLRIHRSKIINMSTIVSIQSRSIQLTDGSIHRIGKTYVKAVKAISF